MAGVADSVYQRSPIWVQNLGIAVWGYFWYRRRFGTEFHRATEEISARDSWTAAEWTAHQDRQLARLLDAARRSPYYREVFAKAGVDGAHSPREALARIPTLGKQTLRERGRDLLTEPPKRDVMVF